MAAAMVAKSQLDITFVSSLFPLCRSSGKLQRELKAKNTFHTQVSVKFTDSDKPKSHDVFHFTLLSGQRGQ